MVHIFVPLSNEKIRKLLTSRSVPFSATFVCSTCCVRWNSVVYCITSANGMEKRRNIGSNGKSAFYPSLCKWVRWNDHAGGRKTAVHFGPRIRLLWYYTIGVVGEYPWPRWAAQWKVHHPILSLFFVEGKTAEGVHRKWQCRKKHAAVNAVPSKNFLRLLCSLACFRVPGI